ncbi:DUF3124 domain-containing protein [Weeksellaceae bacterium KMM 9713]|uniref:DUF3124 domain-containing protein n=1 Tax=Profundicola chukchiensis TaxID=2961959 RepID=A0A9X4N2E9_9FLAO|nr:DUF3124 domain-containing protein [Profundicola chukchiensis]MDG4945444.1 DUF3124 domain-containing protein [Profundicola chukchiensis]MDG4950524.1 DUF3124 domain-containing protein [Profundicola chukchiensis]
MKYAWFLFIITALVNIQCEPPKPRVLLEEEERVRRRAIRNIEDDINDAWMHRKYNYKDGEVLTEGNTYLAVYTEIYARSEKRTYPLTATLSIRNTSLTDSVFINKSEYYDTHGELIRTYFDRTIYVAPMETVEIIVGEDNEQGGSGGNFVFHWATRNPENKPMFEAVMISASGQQGISIMTQGIDIHD